MTTDILKIWGFTNKVAGLLVSHLQKPAVQHLTSDLGITFVGIDFEAELTYGGGCPSMKLPVTEFVPANIEQSHISAATSSSKDEKLIFTNRYPVALRDEALNSLGDTCRTYIKSMVKSQRDFSGLKTRKMDKIIKSLLEAIGRYHGSICPNRNVSFYSSLSETLLSFELDRTVRQGDDALLHPLLYGKNNHFHTRLCTTSVFQPSQPSLQIM
jgi:hypothetical protein